MGSADADRYWVKVTGPCGSDSSTHTELVFNPQVYISKQSSDVKVSNGTSVATLSVEATNASTYQWQKRAANGTWNNLVNSAKISGATSNTLVIKPVTSQDDGAYRAVVSNVCGVSVTSGTMSIKVTGKSAREEAKNREVVQVYPNPSDGTSFVVQVAPAEKARLQLFSSVGASLGIRTRMLNENEVEVSPVNRLSIGTYLIHVQTPQGVITQPVVVQ